MGMFDNIRCEYPLPLPADQGELKGKDWAKQSFQTKDLGESMAGYCIRADGTLWLVSGGWLRNVLSEELFQEKFFGTVQFYNTLYCQKHDYRVEWQATFAEGKLKDIRLDTWQQRDNSERLHQEAQRKAKQERTERFLKSWIGRFIYPPYAWITKAVFNQLSQVASVLSATLEKLRWRFLDRLASRLTPHGDPIGERRWKRYWEKRRLEDEPEETKTKDEEP